MARLVTVDASALIAYLDPADSHHAMAIRGLAEPDGFLIHPVTLAEVLVHPVRERSEVVVTNVLTAIGMVLSPMTIDPTGLARLRVKTGLKLPDCIVLATSIWHKTELLTFDENLRAAASNLLS